MTVKFDGTTKALSSRQERIMAAIRESYHQGRSPTVREVAVAIGDPTGSGTTYYNLRILERHGLIHLHRGTTRGIELVTQPGDPCITCGQTVEISPRERRLLQRARDLLGQARPGPDREPPRGVLAIMWNDDVDAWLQDDRDG